MRLYLIAARAILAGALEAVAVPDLRKVVVGVGERQSAWGNLIEQEMTEARGDD